jgi:heat shock protein HtpX
MSNAFKTTALLALLTGLLMAIGQYLGGAQGLMFAFVFAAAMNLGSYWFSDRIVLATYGAKELDEGAHPSVSASRSSRSAQMPMPRVYLIPASHRTPHTGRTPSHAATRSPKASCAYSPSTSCVACWRTSCRTSGTVTR